DQLGRRCWHHHRPTCRHCPRRERHGCSHHSESDPALCSPAALPQETFWLSQRLRLRRGLLLQQEIPGTSFRGRRKHLTAEVCFCPRTLESMGSAQTSGLERRHSSGREFVRYHRMHIATHLELWPGARAETSCSGARSNTPDRRSQRKP